MEQKLREELYQTNQKLYVAMRAFQMAAEESRSLVFTYDLKRQTIFVDEQTARTFGVAEVQPDVPYGRWEEALYRRILWMSTSGFMRRY